MALLRAVCVGLLSLSCTAAEFNPDGKKAMTLVDGTKIPEFGVGVYMSAPGEEAYQQTKWALELGYRMVDTAQMYGNEEDVGRAVRDSGIERSKLYIGSKLHTDNHGYDKTIKSVMASVQAMNIGYLDYYLIHSPFGGKLIETYDALLELKREGLLKSVGVSNFDIRHLEALKDRPRPVLNQVEMHPMILHERQALVDYCSLKGIVVQAYGSMFFGQKDKLADPKVTTVVQQTGKTAAQVLLRWGLQKGFQLIPKSVKKHRLEENMDIFDFELTHDQMNTLSSMTGRLDAYWNPLKDAQVDLGATHHFKSEL